MLFLHIYSKHVVNECYRGYFFEDVFYVHAIVGQYYWNFRCISFG